MSICVCAKCKKPWKRPSSPARCPDCGQVSFPIAIEIGSQAITAETRAKLSASAKKRWQDPEYRARQIATHTGRHPSPETRAKMSAAAHIGKHLPAETKAKISATLTGRHLPAEARAKMSAAAHIGKHLPAETKAKISAALTGRHLTAETRAKMSAAHIGRARRL